MMRDPNAETITNAELVAEMREPNMQSRTVPGPATSGAYVIKDDSERYMCSVDSAGVVWSVARQRDALRFGTRVAAVRVVQAFSNSMTRIRVVRLRTAPSVALDTAPAPPDKSTNEP